MKRGSGRRNYTKAVAVGEGSGRGEFMEQILSPLIEFGGLPIPMGTASPRLKKPIRELRFLSSPEAYPEYGRELPHIST